MSQYQIAVVIGSLRKDSFNRKLANALPKLAPAEFSFKQLEIGDLPLYNQDDDANPPAAAKRLKTEIAASKGVIFVTPEYNRSIPGVLKNALDHASRPYGQSAWAGKPAGVIGVSVGANGTAMAQQHLRNILAYLDMPAMGQPEAYLHAREGMFDSSGELGPDSKKFVQQWVDRYVAWVKSFS
ncbi:MAG: NAD(P)H-dependent oxidoreductase [Cellvibrionaceae bacterium]|nr:NAD(P)H-dependent oxidoreductase [Cellvibrionaceae bacterium]